MSPRAAELLAEVLKLPEDDRAALADGVYDSLDLDSHATDAMTDEEFLAELERRAEELRRDPSQGIPWEEVEKMR